MMTVEEIREWLQYGAVPEEYHADVGDRRFMNDLGQLAIKGLAARPEGREQEAKNLALTADKGKENGPQELPDAYMVLATGEKGFLAATVWIRGADAEEDAHGWRINGKETEIVPLYQRSPQEGSTNK